MVPESFNLKRTLSPVTTFHSRRLPHLDPVGQPIFLTWRLYGSLPPGRVFPAATSHGRAFVAMDRLLDAVRNGSSHLRRPEVARMVMEALRYHEQALQHYHLHSYVVMPNHVHALITPLALVSKLMQSLKRFTGLEGNRILGVTGQPFWQDESYDRLVRDDREFERIVRYIESNPVSAGLAASAQEFLWSSAWPIDNRPQVGNLPHSADAG
jgi:REP element-mobilizing transposase RayT